MSLPILEIEEKTRTSIPSRKVVPAAESFSLTSAPQRVRLSGTNCAPYYLVPKSAAPQLTFRPSGIEALEEQLLSELDELTKLPDNWDAAGGRAPKQAAVDAASVLIVQLGEAARSRGIVALAPKVVAGGDGSVGFVWRHPSIPWILEVEVGEQGATFAGSVRGDVFEGVLESPEELLPLLPQ